MTLGKHPKDGLELLFDDGERIELTPHPIAAAVQRWLTDPKAIPPYVRGMEEFRPCAICPLSDPMVFCHALHPLLPIADHCGSHDLNQAVTVKLIGAGGGGSGRTRRTSLLGAMDNVALLSLTQYCETGKKYERYYRGASAIVGVEEFSDHIVRNIYEESGGDPEEMRRKAQQFSHDLQTTSHGQICRLRLLSAQEPMINAVVNALILLECLVEEKAAAVLSGAPSYCI